MSPLGMVSTDGVAKVELVPADPAEQRHLKLLRMLGHLKDALAPRLTKREHLRAILMAGMYANSRLSKLDAGQRALIADQDADALLAAGSDDTAGT